MFICFSWFLLTCHEDQQNFHLLVRSVCMLFDSFRVRVMYENFFFSTVKVYSCKFNCFANFFSPFLPFIRHAVLSTANLWKWIRNRMARERHVWKRECLLSTLRPRRFFYSFHHGSLKTKFSRVRAIQSGSL